MNINRGKILNDYYRATTPERWKKEDAAYIAVCFFILVSIGGAVRASFAGPIKPYSGTEPDMKSDRPSIFTTGSVQAVAPTPTPKVIYKDIRINKVRAYLGEKHSPLAEHAETIVNMADKYAIDWTRVVAISGMESSYGTKLPEGSYNAWGLGGSNFMYFASWDESIEYATKLLAKHYRVNELKGIKAKYCPESDNCNPKWAEIVADNSEAILASAY